MLHNPNPLHPTWIAFGWFISVAALSLVVLALVVIGFIVPESSTEMMWTGLAMIAGFAVGGFIAGGRSGLGPLWFGVAMAAMSLVAWAAVNLLAGEPTGVTTWRSLPPLSLVALLVVQLVAAMFGARFALAWATAPVVED
jgi:hypothetical protein